MEHAVDKSIIDIANSLPKSQRELVLSAFSFAKHAHKGQLRKSGRPFLIHPIAVAELLWRKYKDVDLTIAALIHDTVEDNESTTIEEVYKKFGETIGFIIDSVDKKTTSFYRHQNISIEDKIERLIWAGMRDIRCFLVKIADREHNIDTLKYLRNNKQVRMAFETQAIFEPLKKVLQYTESNSIEEASNNFHQCLSQKKISKPSEIKKCLYTMSFRDFSHEMFDLVYNNSHRVVWEIEDKKYLQYLLKNEDFEEHATIENMWTDGNTFKAQFTFDKGYILDSSVDIKVAAYKQR